MKAAYDLLCIDEIGTPNLSEFQGLTKEQIKEYGHRSHFGITGVIISGSNYPDLNVKLRQYQERCFGAGNHKPFHYSEILHNSGKFAELGADQKKKAGVISRLNDLLRETRLRIISSIVDKKTLSLGFGVFEASKLVKVRKIKPNLSKFSNAKNINLYEIALKFVLTEFYKYLKQNKKRGLIIAEARGELEDRWLLDAFYQYQKTGAGVLSGKDIRSYISDLLIIRKTQNHAGTQLADLICFPLFDHYIKDHERTDHFVDANRLTSKVLAVNIFPVKNERGILVSKTIVEQKIKDSRKRKLTKRKKRSGKLRKKH